MSPSGGRSVGDIDGLPFSGWSLRVGGSPGFTRGWFSRRYRIDPCGVGLKGKYPEGG